ncbi:hypothetical protein KIPB_010165 [Kipferlia bialata]|uniref:Uncharacterized protein n=1 Tax=Kipferlia bialata TaxID=797122 RepID=A0A9K3D2P0_9EUKA|nr:hypothetical protein KIPB_010165 [Kipferlia bialata]|eukprot:g10165.t1
MTKAYALLVPTIFSILLVCCSLVFVAVGGDTTSVQGGIYLGTDSGATTSKTGAVWASDGSPVSLTLRQSRTNSQMGTGHVIED